MKFKLSRYMTLIIIAFKIGMYIILLSIPFIIFCFNTLSKGLVYLNDIALLIPVVLFFVFVMILYILFPVSIIRLFTALQKNGFISCDEKNIKLFAITRMIDVEWKDIEKIQLVTAKNGKKCIGIIFSTLENLPKSTANFLDVMKSHSGYHLSYSQANFAEDLEDIYIKINQICKSSISLKKEDSISQT